MAGTQMTGCTENMSRKGVLVRLSGEAQRAGQLQPGDFIETDVELPTRLGSARRSLYCWGVAVWWREVEGDLLLALALEHLRFRDLPRNCINVKAASALVM